MKGRIWEPDQDKVIPEEYHFSEKEMEPSAHVASQARLVVELSEAAG